MPYITLSNLHLLGRGRRRLEVYYIGLTYIASRLKPILMTAGSLYRLV